MKVYTVEAVEIHDRVSHWEMTIAFVGSSLDKAVEFIRGPGQTWGLAEALGKEGVISCRWSVCENEVNSASPLTGRQIAAFELDGTPIEDLMTRYRK